MNKCPTHFYRYRSLNGESCEYVERTVCYNELYFPKPSSFNDPFDCRPCITFEASNEKMKRYYQDKSKKYLPNLNREQRRHKAKEVRNDWKSHEEQQRIKNLHIERITEQVGILCLSTCKDDILMWSHYADSHRGICLEFDGYYEFFAEAMEVSYKVADLRPQINVFQYSPDQMRQDALLTFCTKANHWKYEQEWRIIYYENGPGIYSYPPEALTGIILGAQTPPSSIAKVLSWIEGRAHPVKLYRASPSPINFALDIDEISIDQCKILAIP